MLYGTTLSLYRGKVYAIQQPLEQSREKGQIHLLMEMVVYIKSRALRRYILYINQKTYMRDRSS